MGPELQLLTNDTSAHTNLFRTTLTICDECLYLAVGIFAANAIGFILISLFAPVSFSTKVATLAVFCIASPILLFLSTAAIVLVRKLGRAALFCFAFELVLIAAIDWNLLEFVKHIGQPPPQPPRSVGKAIGCG